MCDSNWDLDRKKNVSNKYVIVMGKQCSLHKNDDNYFLVNK